MRLGAIALSVSINKGARWFGMSELQVVHVPRQVHDAASGKRDLDPVTAFLQDFGPGRGQLTLVCWGRAWSHYWGAMGAGLNLRGFLLRADTGYIVGKLMLPCDVMLKRAERREERWLTQIVGALKDEFREGGAA